MIEQSTIDLNSSDLVHGAQRENAVLGSVEGPGGTFHTTSVALPLCPCCQQPWAGAPKIQLSLDTNIALIKGKPVQLTAQEAEVFGAILKFAPGRASPSAIHREVWGIRYRPETHVTLIKVHVCHIRRKLKGSGFSIKTIWGDGYQLLEDRA